MRQPITIKDQWRQRSSLERVHAMQEIVEKYRAMMSNDDFANMCAANQVNFEALQTAERVFHRIRRLERHVELHDPRRVQQRIILRRKIEEIEYQMRAYEKEAKRKYVTSAVKCRALRAQGIEFDQDHYKWSRVRAQLGFPNVTEREFYKEYLSSETKRAEEALKSLETELRETRAQLSAYAA